MYYDLPTNVENFVEFLNYINMTLTNGVFGLSIVAGMYLIAFLYMNRFSPPEDAAAGSSFVTLVVATPLYAIGLIPFNAIIALITLLGASLFLLQMRR